MIRPLVLSGLIMLASVGVATAQDTARFSFAVEAQGVQPVLGLAERFTSFPSATVSIGISRDPRTRYDLRFNWYDFARADRLDLVIEPSEVNGIQEALIDVGLEILGAGVHVERRLSPVGRLQPFVTVGGGFYHWRERRGAYDDDTVFLTELERSQWSGGLTGGLGAGYAVARTISLNAAVDYNIIFGELWPTLDLGLENVSTFQFASLRLGVRVFI
jgi:opacity protein-like surface antigen